MVPYYGDFAEDDTVLIPFNTFSSDDPAASVTITNLLAADLKVHKDGSVTQIVTDGATIAIDFDGITGNHLVTIDTSVSADYATGSEYSVRMEGTTVDGGTINAWLGSFSIERAGGALAISKLIQAAVITNAAGADVAEDIIALKAETVLIVADTGELQVDWVNGGRLDLLLDAVNTTTPPTVGAIADQVWEEAQVDHVAAGSFGVTASEIAALQTDLDNGTDGLGALKTLIDTVNTDLANGTDGLGALKTLIDTVNTDLGNATDGLGALKTLIDTVNTDLANGTDGLGALKTLIDTVNSDLANGTDGLGALKTLIDALNDITAAAVMTTQMTESYAADGTAPTPAQALHLILAMVSEFAISGTTLTAKKLDGSATAATFTLSDATNPTSITRAS